MAGPANLLVSVSSSAFGMENNNNNNNYDNEKGVKKKWKRKKTYPKLGNCLDVCPPSLLKDSLRQVVEVPGGIGIVEALSKAVDEDAGIRARHNNSRVGAVLVAQRQEASSLRVL